MAYFRDEREEHGEQIRLAVSEPGDPTVWTPVAGGDPVLRSTVGENGVRDPFLVRHPPTGRIHLLATDLRIHPDFDWDRPTRHGSRALVAWSTDDLRTWSGPALVEVSPPEAGNTWAPKAVWLADREEFLVVWACALYEPSADRTGGAHQRLLSATTRDFATFSPARVHLDPGHDVIDASLVEHGGRWFRFSVDRHDSPRTLAEGVHITQAVGASPDDPAFRVIRTDVGSPELVRGEGPAVFADSATGWWYLLIDEFALTGYHLFRSRDLLSGEWEEVAGARLPPSARHGSVIPISLAERATLLA